MDISGGNELFLKRVRFLKGKLKSAEGRAAAERSQLRRFGHLLRMPPGHLLGEVF